MLKPFSTIFGSFLVQIWFVFDTGSASKPNQKRTGLWYGFGMVLVWFWYGFGLVLVWFEAEPKPNGYKYVRKYVRNTTVSYDILFLN